MRFGLERMTALLGALGRPASGPRRPCTWWAPTASRPPRASPRPRPGRRGRAGGRLPVAPRHRLDRAHPGRRRADRRPRAFAAAVGGGAGRRPRGLRSPDGDDGDPVRGAHGGGLLDASARPGRTRAWSRPASAAATTPPTSSSPGAAVALTNIALEHTEFLGDTEEAIAAEKLAVCADGSRPPRGGPAQPAGARVAVDGRVRPPRPAPPALRPRSDGPRDVGGGGGDHPAGRLPGPAPAARRTLPARQPGGRGGRGRDAARASPSTSPALAAAVAGVAHARAARGGRTAVPPIVLDGAHNPAGDGGHGRVAPGGARRASPGGGGGLGARRQGRRRDARRRSPRWSTGSSSPARGTRERRPRRTSRRSPTASGSPRAWSRGPGRRPSRGPRWRRGPDGVVLVTGSLYLLVDLRRYALGEGCRPPC